MIIGISGYGRSGKNAVGDILVNQYGFKQIAFADELRRVLYALNPLIGTRAHGEPFYLRDCVDEQGWDEAKAIPEVRRLLQFMGTDVGRNLIDQDIWIKMLEKTIYRDPLDGGVNGYWVITDARFRNEAQWIQRYGRLLRVNRPGFGPINDHVSEINLDGYPFNGEIKNEGTLEDLVKETERVMAGLGWLKINVVQYKEDLNG